MVEAYEFVETWVGVVDPYGLYDADFCCGIEVTEAAEDSTPTG